MEDGQARGWLLIEHVTVPGVDHVREWGYYTREAAELDKTALEAEYARVNGISYSWEVKKA